MDVKPHGSIRGLCAAIVAISIMTAAHSRELQQGDPNYPQTNPDPRHSFTLHGRFDPAIDVHFLTSWVSTNPSCAHFTKETIFTGEDEPSGASIPLDLQQDADGFSAQVSVDGVLPGRCRWEFRGVSAVGSDKQGHPLALMNGPNLTPVNSPPLQPGSSPDGLLNLECKVMHVSNGISGPYSLVCRASNLQYRSSHVWWYPETKDVEVNFRFME